MARSRRRGGFVGLRERSLAGVRGVTQRWITRAIALPLAGSLSLGGLGVGSAAEPSDRAVESGVKRFGTECPVNRLVAQETGVVERSASHAAGHSAPLFSSVGNLLTALPLAAPFPQIHPQARLGRVPVLMYHDVLPRKEVFFDVTPAEFEAHLQAIRDNGLTPIHLDQLVAHLATGAPLPPKPVLLSFDDGYLGHYEHVYPLLKQYGYPGVFAIYTGKVERNYGRPGLTWAQLREMAADPLVAIASHSITHPKNLADLDDHELRWEVTESKRILEEKLGVSVKHFVYPEGNYDERVKAAVRRAGYRSALTMSNQVDRFASESEDLLSIDRLGQSKLSLAIAQTDGGAPLPPPGSAFNFTAPVRKRQLELDGVRLVLFSGGRPVTLHADSRYQVSEIIANTPAVAAVDGGFFSMKYLDSNVMIGPVYSQNTGQFVPGSAWDISKIGGRPLVLVGPDGVKFIPFDPQLHNTLAGIRKLMPDVTDAFVAGAWLVKDGKGRSPETFRDLFGFDVPRHRAFWGIDQAAQPVVGVSKERIDSVALGELLSRAGLREVVMLDSGASASLAHGDELLVDYTPRPVPHAVALFPPVESEMAQGCEFPVARAESGCNGRDRCLDALTAFVPGTAPLDSVAR
ncbi:polysaccharide deacetylase family protein [Thermoleptolyngbya sp. C42_A2020_037]|uniref:polysaccharide deacetylase family protein n=1 Tax=Thermoleptolyngbya sp. C42_A2020_037 TaxID=2747799 RepID=UPI0019E20C91|nr:polysaccharide deacetylase family protein [Thermoleptolyngbya sp. C42_A2020_037]MBF2083127.1 polysaccharide deacetylase family protein [Thermoleptolyngbya sp. C42_A2020_037]